MKNIVIILLVLSYSNRANCQSKFIEFGIGAKNDFYRINPSGSVFQTNFDIGALIHFSFSKKINEKILWQAGWATNNYKLNIRVNSPTGQIFTERELVSVMRSARVFFNLNYLTKIINEKISIVSSAGVSLIVLAKNPNDWLIERQNSIETKQGIQSIKYSIKTFGLTGSAILLNADTRVYYTINEDINFVTTLAFTSGTGQLTKAEVNYAINSAPQYSKVIIETKGFSPFISLGIQYKLKENSK